MAADPTLVPAVNLSKMAREIAMDIYPREHIQKTHQLSNEQWNAVIMNPDFQRMLSEMIVDWRSASGTRERVRVKAQTAIEAALESIYSEITNASIPFTQRIDGVKMLAKLGDLGEREALVGGAGGSVNISINLGIPGEGINQTVTIENEPLEVTP